MGANELIDYFDDNMNYLGATTRDEVHQKGLWHKTFHCWVLMQENGKQYLIFQKRSRHKQHFPNMYDITAAGHYGAGEGEQESARELEEEIGVKANFNDLIFLGIRQDVAIIDKDINREFCYTYFLESKQSLESYDLQQEELAGLLKVELSEGLALIAGEKKQIEASGFILREDASKEFININLTKQDLIPHPDNYYLKVFIMAERYFQGKKYLAI